MQNNIIIKIENLYKEFKVGADKLSILENANLEIYKGQTVAIVGPSGSGKSTLLSILAGMDKANKGKVIVKGKDLESLNNSDLAKYRNEDISIIFQSFELIAPFTVLENVTAPLYIRGQKSASEIESKATKLLADVGLSKRANAFPSTLSGGEKQRTAIARSLCADTDIILADEPTGSLDTKTGQMVLSLLIKEVKERGKTLVIITHDMAIASQMDRVIEVKDRNLYEKNK
jgi:putative ABC transport system ATP-binding protein